MRRSGAFALLLSAILLGCPAPAPDEAEAGAVTLPVPSDPTITFKVWFDVGAMDDPPGKEGLAYITGEMIADASTTENRYEAILEALYPMAAGYGIRVDREMTVLTGRVHRDNLDAYYGLFSDAFLRPAFLEEDFQRIRADTLNFLTNGLRFQDDEELGKAALQALVYEGSGYAHPIAGTVAGVEAITLDDVREFYGRHYVRENAVPAIGGGYDRRWLETFRAGVASLPSGEAHREAAPALTRPDGHRVLLVDKPGADASISFGFPIDVRRGEREFYALWLANSWLGEHRNSASHLYKVIREARGMNYGDYSYIEAYPEGGRRSVPPTHVARGRQMFEVWIRTLPDADAHFALRAAVREVDRLVREGLDEERFELTREFLGKYILHFAPTTEGQLAYRVDDLFYGIEGEGHLARFREILPTLTLDEVNAAIRKHLRAEDLYVAMVTGEAEAMADRLAADAPSPKAYDSPKPEAIVTEDAKIAVYPLGIDREAIRIVPVTEIFGDSERAPAAPATGE